MPACSQSTAIGSKIAQNLIQAAMHLPRLPSGFVLDAGRATIRLFAKALRDLRPEWCWPENLSYYA